MKEIIYTNNLNEYLAKICSVVFNKESKNSEALVKRLLIEAYNKTPSRPLEFVPIKHNSAPNTNQTFGFYDRGYYYSNAREWLNNGKSLEWCLERIDLTYYRTVKILAPYFIYQQLSTHTQITTLSHSQRYSEVNYGYFKPAEIRMGSVGWDNFVTVTPPKELKEFMKKSGVNRKEIYDRGADMLQIRPFVLGVWLNNPNSFEWLFNQRTDKHTQKETCEVVEDIKKLLLL